MKVWVVEGWKGCQDECSNWVLGIFSTEEKALAAMTAADADMALARQKEADYFRASSAPGRTLEDRLATWDRWEHSIYTVTNFEMDVSDSGEVRVCEELLVS
jgi:hypothetical protein